MRYEFIDKYQKQFPVSRMCQVLEVSPSGYYAWRNRPVCQRVRENQELMVEIASIYTESGETYGSPRIHTELVDRGRMIGKNRVARLMRAEQIGVFPKKRRPITTNSKHDYPIAPNILNRAFHAERPNEKWLGDITYIRTGEGWLYLAAVLDMFSRKIVGWAMDDNLESQLVMKAFLMAARIRKPTKGLLHHSDRGSQYASDVYQACLADYHIQVSMSRTGNCYDNAPMESFFSTLKSDRVHRIDYQTRQEAKTDIFRYIEGFYNRTRRHSSLGYLSPDSFERQFFQNLA
jgi:putative transposase